MELGGNADGSSPPLAVAYMRKRTNERVVSDLSFRGQMLPIEIRCGLAMAAPPRFCRSGLISLRVL